MHYLPRFTGLTVPDAPHFDPASTDEFLRRLSRASLYLEFGSGGSTMAAAGQGLATISVENDPSFARAVSRKLPQRAFHHMIAVDIGLTRQWGNPLFHTPTPRRVARWRRYIDLPFEYLGETASRFPDLILIDGRFRRACALESARRAKLAGSRTAICFDDYANRPGYHDVEDYLGNPVMHGRMAIFEIGSATADIPAAAVDSAIRDFH